MQNLKFLKFTKLADLKYYLDTEVKPHLPAGWPRMVVLHNAAVPHKAWPGFDVHGHRITPQQRIKNMSVDWVSRGMTKPPHAMFTIGDEGQEDPELFEDAFWVMGDLTKPGQHSKEWNAVSWGFEMFADFDIDQMPPRFFTFVCAVLRLFYDLAGREPNDDTFKLHLEDVISKHFHCPGKNAQPKSLWINGVRLAQRPGEPAPVGLGHLDPVPRGAGAWINDREGEVLVAYKDGTDKATGAQLYAIGNGTQIYPDGTRVKADDVCTPEQAAKWRDVRIASDWSHARPLVKVPVSENLGIVICSFCYEFTAADFATSTWLRLLNAGDVAGAQASFASWNHKRVNGELVEDPGLTHRRTLEIALWNQKPAASPVPVPVSLPAGGQPAPSAVPSATSVPPKPGNAPLAPPIAAPVAAKPAPAVPKAVPAPAPAAPVSATAAPAKATPGAVVVLPGFHYVPAKPGSGFWAWLVAWLDRFR